LSFCESDPFEQLVVIADSHREGKQLFEGLPRFGKLDGDPASGDRDTGREVPELLAHDPDGSLDQHLR